ncbi:MAG: hypothetical protein WAW17_05400 [Rhodococcus sp. (in: high G+C Gram-positive bacteria)]|uniref:hypothetical protein n=1 Tax=Rhodococcus sp. TaxID=1831 RepID=UPI003BB07BBA
MLRTDPGSMRASQSVPTGPPTADAGYLRAKPPRIRTSSRAAGADSAQASASGAVIWADPSPLQSWWDGIVFGKHDSHASMGSPVRNADPGAVSART